MPAPTTPPCWGHPAPTQTKRRRACRTGNGLPHEDCAEARRPRHANAHADGSPRGGGILPPHKPSGGELAAPAMAYHTKIARRPDAPATQMPAPTTPPWWGHPAPTQTKRRRAYRVGGGLPPTCPHEDCAGARRPRHANARADNSPRGGGILPPHKPSGGLLPTLKRLAHRKLARGRDAPATGEHGAGVHGSTRGITGERGRHGLGMRYRKLGSPHPFRPARHLTSRRLRK